LEAADDFSAVEAVSSSSFGVAAGAGVVAETADGDHVQRSVGLAVAAVVEAVAVAAPGARLDRRRTADFREGGFGRGAVDVLAGCDEQLAGALGADAEERDGARGRSCDELLELSVELVEFSVEVADATGEASERELGGLERFVQPAGVGA